MNAHQATKDFETALCAYTGAPYAVAVSSCTMALQLALAFHIWRPGLDDIRDIVPRWEIEIPKHTYVSVPMAIWHAGGRPVFRDEDWLGAYQLKPLPVWDCARWFTSGMYVDGKIRWTKYGRYDHEQKLDLSGSMACLSFHASKILGDTQGGAILHDNPEADAWLRRARFDGRTEGVAPKDDTFNQIGYHCYMSPDVATRLLWKLSVLPRHNAPLKNDDYPPLDEMEIFK